MADCGICLDVLRNPVSVPCGHVHCERCLRGHINAGADALKSTCPTCRKPFYIVTPDLAFVSQKYHPFILPSVRKIYMDIPSVATLTKEVGTLTQRLNVFTRENEHLRQCHSDYKVRLEDNEADKRGILAREETARQEMDCLRRKYDLLKRKYREIQSRDGACYALHSCRSVQSLDSSQEILPKEEEDPISLQDFNPPRPKRALPKSRLLGNVRHKDPQTSQLIKRQRTHRHSDIGPSSRPLDAVLKYEDEEDE